ncbi:hypothetical protein HDU98_003264 [Podochytrium sp. JEL0797]|nr:hypothetical protein HDU98_003264 [Podochytrium sp. JEL0797]
MSGFFLNNKSTSKPGLFGAAQPAAPQPQQQTAKPQSSQGQGPSQGRPSQAGAMSSQGMAMSSQGSAMSSSSSQGPSQASGQEGRQHSQEGRTRAPPQPSSNAAKKAPPQQQRTPQTPPPPKKTAPTQQNTPQSSLVVATKPPRRTPPPPSSSLSENVVLPSPFATPRDSHIDSNDDPSLALLKMAALQMSQKRNSDARRVEELTRDLEAAKQETQLYIQQARVSEDKASKLVSIQDSLVLDLTALRKECVDFYVFVAYVRDSLYCFSYRLGRFDECVKVLESFKKETELRESNLHKESEKLKLEVQSLRKQQITFEKEAKVSKDAFEGLQKNHASQTTALAVTQSELKTATHTLTTLTQQLADAHQNAQHLHTRLETQSGQHQTAVQELMGKLEAERLKFGIVMLSLCLS